MANQLIAGDGKIKKVADHQKEFMNLKDSLTVEAIYKEFTNIKDLFESI